MTDLRVFTRLNHLLLSLIAVTTIAGVVRIPADAQLPVHFDLFGQPDRFAGRDDALILMPAFGLNPNVMCFLNDIYAYLKARSDGAIPRGRPAKHAPKPPEAKEHEDACLGRS